MPMSNSEEALDDFPAENPISPDEFMVGAYRAESTDEWTAASGITSKIHPLYDGVTSWFKCEELIEDRFDLAVLEVSKGGAALKNRLFSELQKSIKGRLNRESLRADDGVKYFRDTLRPHFIKGAQSVFFWSGTEMVDWIGKFFFSPEAFERFMDGLVTVVCHESATKRERERESQYQADVTHLNAERRNRKLRRPCTLMNKRPETTGTQHM